MLNNTQDKISIIYVEDESSIAQLLVYGLGVFGIEVNPVYVSAAEMLAGMDEAAVKEATLFFLDMRLPGMSGLELAYELRRRGETRPFIFVSGFPAPADEELARLNARFLPKPFVFPDMLAMIQQLVSLQTEEKEEDLET